VESSVAAFILAGGKSTRMGTDKAFVELKGRTLLDRILETSRSVTRNVAIIGSTSKFSPYAPVIQDLFPDCGPLAGIHAALQSSRSDLNLILAVDLPFVTQPLLEFLLGKAAESTTTLITVPRTSQGWQPLCAVYRREFRQVAEDALRDGRYKIDPLFEPARTQAIPEEDLRTAGFFAEVFRNLNTPEDLVEVSRNVPPTSSGY
jgi:molybdopterin-guanine dinucleotide biosynthesis protein A